MQLAPACLLPLPPRAAGITLGAPTQEKRGPGVTTADMSRLMNMSAKIGNAIKAYRAHRVGWEV